MPTAAGDVDQAERMLGALAPFDLEYAEQPCATLDEHGRAAPPGRRAAGRRRVDPPGRGSAAGARRRARPTSWCSRPSRSAACGRRCRSPRPAGCRSSCPVQSIRRSGWRPASPSRPRCPSFRYACGLATMSLLAGRRHGRAADRGRRRAAGPARGRGRGRAGPVRGRPGGLAGAAAGGGRSSCPRRL